VSTEDTTTRFALSRLAWGCCWARNREGRDPLDNGRLGEEIPDGRLGVDVSETLYADGEGVPTHDPRAREAPKSLKDGVGDTGALVAVEPLGRAGGEVGEAPEDAGGGGLARADDVDAEGVGLGGGEACAREFGAAACATACSP